MNESTVKLAPAIPLQEVTSSQIAAIGHDGATTLAIRFRDRGDIPGPLYHYENYTAEDFAAFLAAESPGAFFAANIKRHADKYPYARIA